MSAIFSRDVSLLLSLTAFTVISSGMPVKAEMTKAADTGTMSSSSVHVSEPIATQALSDSGAVSDENLDASAVDPQQIPTQKAKDLLSQDQQPNPAGADEALIADTNKDAEGDRILQPTASTADDLVNTQTVSSNLATSATALKSEPATSQVAQITPENQGSKVAQTNTRFGQPTRSGPSYIGVGLNLDGAGFEVISKIGISSTLSVRPVVDFNDGGTFFYVPLTYDFTLEDTDTLPLSRFSPYAGAGIAFATGSGESEAAILATGGVDFAINPQFTATARLDVGLNNAVGTAVTIGVGYNFLGF